MTVHPIHWWLMGKAVDYWLPSSFVRTHQYPTQYSIFVGSWFRRDFLRTWRRVRTFQLLRCVIRAEARRRSIKRFGTGHYVGRDGW